ncbi:MAG: hypothetical protein IT258_12040 [Saprospiraceae bacterium]|nr:hypothetical protein [Saprospiraceae bacterium]
MKQLVFAILVFGFIGCKQEAATTETAATTEPAAKQPAVNETVQNLFEEVNVVKMHLFGTKEAEPTQEKYPYTGKLVNEADLQYFSPELHPNEVGGVYACYRTEYNGFYILRVPGKYASSDLALAKWDANTNKLVKVMDLAMLQCDEGLCHQQDAWLTDLDDDRSLELVIRKAENDNGKISKEEFTVLMQQPPGSFTKAPEQLASLAPPTSYVLYK